MLRAIFFDFNGVLVDDEPIHFELLQRVLGEEGISIDAAAYRDRFLGIDDRSCFETALASAGREVSPASIARLIARKAAYYRRSIQEGGFPFFPGAARLIAEAASSPLMLGLVSGALREEVEAAIRKLGVRECFKTIVTAEDVEKGKPDPAPYLRALDNLNSLPPLPSRLIHPHEVLAVEDSPAGLESAAACGLSTLAVAHTYPADRLGRADLIAGSLAEVSLRRIRRSFGE